MKTAQKGFTLIELMIVVAIIAILAAIAIPQYQAYVIRSQVTRVMGEVGDQKVVVEDCLNNGFTTVGTNGSTACNSTATTSNLLGSAISFSLADTGAADITADFGDQANTSITGETLEWTRSTTGTWTCTTTVLAKYAPASCQPAAT